MTWRTRRKLLVGTTVCLILAVIIAVPVYFIFFTGVPTCTDGLQNGLESGIDCGGQCIRVCPNEASPLVLVSKGAFEVSPGVYNAVALVENNNISAGAFDVNYRLYVADENGTVLDEQKGTVDIAQNSKFPIFAAGLRTNGEAPAETVLELGTVSWVRNAPSPEVAQVRLGSIQDENTAPRINGTVVNTTDVPTSALQVVAVVSDDEGNPVGVSSTSVAPLSKDASQNIYFAWPQPFVVGSRVCAVNDNRKTSSYLGDVVLVIDRSGSMDDENINPPEPLNTVRLAAIHFAESMATSDRGAVVSFANDATIDQSLTGNISSLTSVIDTIEIQKDTIQNTNIADGLLQAVTMLSQEGADTTKRKSIVLLTDGIATRPLDPTDPEYPETYARDIAGIARDNNIEVYVIGLGTDLNEAFLREIASGTEYYFGAPDKDSLLSIYDTIATSICKKRPAIVNAYIIKK